MLTILSIVLFFHLVFAQQMPPPFYRELKVTSPYMTGNDVLIAQTLLLRDSAVDKSLVADGIYKETSASATSSFQSANELKSTGTLDSASAQLLLDLHSDDNYKDSGFTAASMGYLYKFHIPVHVNRSVETMSTLYDANNNIMLQFRIRTHGKRADGTDQPWPDYGNGDIGLTQFASSGDTVTGLVEIDLNSPEPNPQVYGKYALSKLTYLNLFSSLFNLGPWPVNRIVRGLDGNALLRNVFI